MTGNGAAVILEPLVVTFFGHASHPAIGSIKIFETMTRTIPWHIFFLYTVGFGAMYLVLFPKVLNGTVTPKYIWSTCAFSVSLYIVVEILPVSSGLWVYYDNQPLWLWSGMAPLPWSFMNTACEVVGAALICLLFPYLKGQNSC